MISDARTVQESMKLIRRPWRVGRKVKRNIYVQVGAAPSDDDVIIGQMDSGTLALAAVQIHNAWLAEEIIMAGE